MSKILLVDISIQGHRKAYLKALQSEQILYLLPCNDQFKCDYIQIESGFDIKRTIRSYLCFLKEINDIVKKNNVIVVHFLCGDALYRFFGFGLSSIKAKIIVTFHHMVFKFSKRLAIKHIFKNINYGVVHTESLYVELSHMGINNSLHIEYPIFNQPVDTSVQESRKIFGMDTDKLVLAVIGGTQYYKGLDILLDALQLVTHEFHLFICGPERYFDKKYIIDKMFNRLGDVTLELRFLNDIEYQHAVNVADIIVLPYRREFDGASGPLSDSTIYRKMIIASEHGSLGNLVSNNHLGLTFRSESPKDLSVIIERSFESKFVWDHVAESYRNSLSVEKFVENYQKAYGLIRGD